MNRLPLTGIAAALTLAIAGCVTPPKDQPLEKTLDGAALTGATGPAIPAFPEGWWRVYGDQQLDGLIENALANSPSLAEARARLRQAQSQADYAKAGQLPAFALDATETAQRFSGNDVIPPPYGGGFYWRGSVLGDMSWDIDFWGRQSALIEQARDLRQAAVLQIESSKLLLSGAIAQAYVDLDRSYALADIAQRAETQRQTILDIARKRVTAGLDTQFEIRQAEAAVPQARVQRSQALAAAELATHQLAALTAQGPQAYPNIARPTVALETALALPEALPVDLLARRPDVLAARLRVDAADKGRDAAKAAFYPSISLSAFAGWGAIGLSDLFDSKSQMYGIGPTLHLPIFEAQKLKSTYRGATAEIDAAVAQYNQTVLHAVQQVADQLTRIAALKTQIADQQQSLDAAEDAYALAEKRYGAGLTGQLPVLNSETQVLAARQQKVELIAAQAIARVTLLLSLGGSFDPSSLNPGSTSAPSEATP